MRSAPRALLAGLIAPLAVSVAACGSSSGLLSGQQASSLRAGLDQINNALNQHDCSAAQSETVALKSRFENLPSSVNGTVRSSLTQAANKLEALVSKDCAPVSTNTQPQTTPTTTTTITTTSTSPPPPKKRTKPHTTPATTPTQTGTTTTGTTPGSGNGKGNGKGDGNGKGQGGGDPTTPTTPTTPGNP
ncbi:MAG TPA: hypothetical protein VGL78_11745 [Solirubrobacteraceae bacterium]